MSQPKLSICIPTYNRAFYLDLLLQSITSQISCNETSIELVISDNASSDNTNEIVKKYINEGFKLEYLQNVTNIGPDRNIAQCFIRAKGEYVWIVGDDDALILGALSSVMEIISTSKYGLIYLSAIGYNKVFPSNVRVETSIKKIECTKVKFARYVNIFLTFISGNIINKNIFLKYSSDAFITQYYETSLVQLSWTYLVLIKADSFLYIKTPLVISKIGNTGGYSLFQTFSKNLFNITSTSLSTQPKIMRIIINSAIISFFPSIIVSRKKLNNFNSENNIEQLLKETFHGFPYFWIFIFPLFKINKVFSLSWLFLSKIFNTFNKAIGNIFL